MVIKRQHPFVNPSGLVSIPYLQNWVYPSSNLVDLARNLSNYFGSDPPLYSQRRPTPNPNPNSNPSPNASFNASGSSGLMSPGSIRPAIPPRSYPPSPYVSASGRIPSPSPPQRMGSGSTQDPDEVHKRNMINQLVDNVHDDVGQLRKMREAEMEGMFCAQGVLRQREEDLLKGLREMQDEKEGLEQQLQMVLMDTDVLEGWVRENESKLGGDLLNVNVDDVIVPSDSFSEQMLECTASDLAIEDIVYALDKALQEGSIPFDLYLRNVRLLSREQFFHRATSGKVRAIQMQAQVSSMASRAQPYVV